MLRRPLISRMSPFLGLILGGRFAPVFIDSLPLPPDVDRYSIYNTVPWNAEWRMPRAVADGRHGGSPGSAGILPAHRRPGAPRRAAANSEASSDGPTSSGRPGAGKMPALQRRRLLDFHSALD